MILSVHGAGLHPVPRSGARQMTGRQRVEWMSLLLLLEPVHHQAASKALEVLVPPALVPSQSVSSLLGGHFAGHRAAPVLVL